MSYQAAIEQLNAMTPELYARPDQPRRKFSLDEVRTLLAAFGDPQRRFPSLLIAGTNGKGSTAATLASILSAAGVRAGLYTSPHLQRVNERIRIGAEEIGNEDFARLFFQVQEAAQSLLSEGKLPQPPSFFEVLTALALLYFAEQKVELAVLEVGMGGRLDATNAVDPLLAIITDISLDHTEWLGSTISAIAREKAGILRTGGTLITLPQHPEANHVLGETAAALDVRVVNAASYLPQSAEASSAPYSIKVFGTPVEIASPLIGAHQQRNRALAIAAAVELASSHGFPITPVAIAEGIRRTRWPGRLERISPAVSNGYWMWRTTRPAHGRCALGSQRCSAKIARALLIFSCLRDKPVAEMAQILFPLFDQVIFAPIHSARAATIESWRRRPSHRNTSAVCHVRSAGIAMAPARRGQAAWWSSPVRFTWWVRRASLFC